MVNHIELGSKAEYELRQLNSILDRTKREEKHTYVTLVCSPPLENGLRNGHNGFLLGKGRENDGQYLRRLKYAFVQEQAMRGIVIYDPETGEELKDTYEGRITRRKHSHNRSWGERYGDFRPRSASVASSVGTLDMNGHYWAYDKFEDIPRMDVLRAGKRDWRRLQRSNASRPELTLESVMPSQLIEMGSKK